MSETVEIELRGPICIVSLHRPAKLNAISEQMERELCDAVASPEVQRSSCIVFTGGPDVFSAGADLSGTGGYAPEEIAAHYQGTGDFAERVAGLRQPTLSAIAGYCIGGGLELALATDFRIAEPSAEFRFPEVALGILPSWGGAARTVRLLGVARAKELMILRDRVDAHEAFRLGLVTELVDEGRALGAVARAGRASRAAAAARRQCHQPRDRPAAGELARRGARARAAGLRNACADRGGRRQADELGALARGRPVRSGRRGDELRLR